MGEGNGTPLQYSCLENPMDGGTWWAAVHGVAKSRTRLSNSGDWVFGKYTVPGGSFSPLCPSCLVSQVLHESTVPGVLCVSSGELISVCDTLGRC